MFLKYFEYLEFVLGQDIFDGDEEDVVAMLVSDHVLFLVAGGGAHKHHPVTLVLVASLHILRHPVIAINLRSVNRDNTANIGFSLYRIYSIRSPRFYGFSDPIR